MIGFEFVLEKSIILLHFFRDTFSDFFTWFFTEVDGGVLGTIAPYQLFGFTLITSFIFARIALGINK